MRAALAVVAIVLVGCASKPTAIDGTVEGVEPSVKPDLRITQTSRIAPIATHQSGAVSVQYRIDVANRTKEPMKLNRIDLQTLGTSGAYSLPLLSKPYAIDLKPGESAFVDLAGPAYILDAAFLAANGSVTLRLIVDYTTGRVRNQTVYVQQVFPPED